MDEAKRQLQGSPSRDVFKRKHKDLGSHLWGLDLDFCIIEKSPFPDIVAAYDFKQLNDSITFTEVIAYNALLKRGIDVYIVSGDPELGQFSIGIYKGGHHGKPTHRIDLVATTENWTEFGQWETQIRQQWRQKFSP